MKASRQGQRAGECKVKRLAVRVSRPGSASSRRRRVRAARTVAPGRPSNPSSAPGEGGDRRPGGVGVELARGEVGERLILEVADRQLDHGVAGVLCLDERQGLGAVGEEGEVAPVGKELGLSGSGAAPRSPRCSPPSAIALNGVITLRPGLAVPDPSPRSKHSSTSGSIPSFAASAAGSMTPALATALSSSKTTAAESFTMRVTS